MSKPPPDTTLESRRANARRLREAVRRLVLAHGALDDAQRPCGSPLPMPHAYALIELLQAGPMTISNLAQLLNIDRTNVSRLCARMEADGELRRKHHPEDKRARLVQLTAKGTRVARSVDASSVKHFESVLASLGSESDRMVEILLGLAGAMGTTSSSMKAEQSK